MFFHRKDPVACTLVRANATGVARRIGGSVCPWLLLVGLLVSGPTAAAEPKRADFRQVAEAVVAYFRTVPDFGSVDLMSQSQVAGALDAVAVAGWNVPNREQLVSLALPDNSFLLKQSATPAGKRFLRSVAAQPGGYARLDRLSTISRGKKLIRDLINDKDGYLMIEYLATTSGGHEMGKMMADTRGGVDLNKPTGRIYTIEDLLQALAKTYSGETQ
jgi:hypothetical protein